MNVERPPLAAPDGGGHLTLVASTQRRWIADDLRTGAPDDVTVRHDMGLDALTVEGRCAWWAPAIHAARLLRAGVALNLSAPGPRWLGEVDASLTGRDIWCGRLDELDTASSGWAKPAEAKVDGLAAQWWDDLGEFVLAARSAGLPPDAWVQVADRRLDIVEEHRSFVTDTTPGLTSPYLDVAGRTYDLGWEHDPGFDHAGASRFTTEVVDALGELQPRSYALDVAKLADGSWVLLEANPAWCSGFYGCELTSVVTAVIAASDDLARHGRWQWVPDPYLVADAARRPLLRPWVPAWSRTR